MSSGRPAEALSHFLRVLPYPPLNGWAHYHAATSQNALGDPHAGLTHAGAASRELQDYKVFLAQSESLSALGETEALLALATEHLRTARFWGAARPVILAAPRPTLVAQWLSERPALLEEPAGQDGWLSFWRRHLPVLQAFRSQARVPDLSLSPTLPQSLLLIDPAELEDLLHCATQQPIHLQFASWDLPGLIRDPSLPNSLYRQLPWHVRHRLRHGLKLVLDASEEAPLVEPSDLTGMARQLGGDADRIAVLTANTRLSATAGIMECNFYSISLVLEALSQPIPPLTAGQSSPPAMFSLLNGIPRAHRIALMLLLRRHGLLATTDYSWWGAANRKNWRGLDPYLGAMEGLLEAPAEAEEIDWIRALPARQIPGPATAMTRSNTHFLCDSINFDYMRAAKVHIVSETEFAQPYTLRLTEKSMKPLLAGVPFVMVGVQGLVAHLRDQGFDLLDDLIDHGYDAEPHPARRLQRIVAELQRLQSVTFETERLQRYHQGNLQRLQGWAEALRKRYIRSLLDWCRQPAGQQP